ncbi:hypothetical protein CH293_06785 [Rhodococcus sp. 14-2470-1b]|jgi:hypothetical protein|uniref:hypothetical protein n=1 Tax=Rhodococcus sp. 14-2470-1b TaxID=2023149 RepID=UPI000B9AAA96|nr:hypothetical protein [Rhodococcus sp. 14-2470-1b]OZF55210.1 hypothetical protein CH293_06785 [Rhodococcus sp. 14-2470-1b]
MNPDHGMSTLPDVESAQSITAVLLSAGGESDGWAGEVFEALCRTHARAHLHFILPPPSNTSMELCTSMSAAFGAFTGPLPEYSTADTVVAKLAVQLAPTGRGWSWAASPSVIGRSATARSKPRTVLGAGRRPLYALWFRALRYRPI